MKKSRNMNTLFAITRIKGYWRESIAHSNKELLAINITWVMFCQILFWTQGSVACSTSYLYEKIKDNNA